MPNERISMSKLKQLIELQSSNLSVRALSRALGLSVGAVSKYLLSTSLFSGQLFQRSVAQFCPRITN